MLGFIIKGNPKIIVDNLKKKIQDFHPGKEIDNLVKQKVLGQELSFQSSHQRLNQKDIHLYHLFFDFTKD